MVAIKRTQFVAGRKLASAFLGRYKVIKVIRNGRYEMQKAAEVEGPNTTTISSDNMELWCYVKNNEEDLPSGTDDEQNERV